MARSTTIDSNRHWFIFSIMTIASMFSYFHQVGLSTVSGEVGASLGANAAGLGLLAAAFAYPYAAMQIPAGLLSDTLGSRKSVTAALMTAAAGTLVFATADGMTAAVIGRILIGLGIAVIAVPLMKLTAVWFPASAFGNLTAISFTVGGLGLLLATSPMAYAGSLIGWRNTYFVLAALTALCALAVWIIVRDHKGRSDGSDLSEHKMSLKRLKEMFAFIISNKQAWMLGFWYFCQGGIYYSFIGLWSGQFLTNGMGLTVQESGWVLALPACALMTAPLFTWAAGRAGSRRVLPALSVAAILLSLPLAAGLPKLPLPLLSLYLLAFSMSAIGGAAVLFAAAKDLFSVEYSGTVTGFINIFPFLGGAIMQQLTGIFVATSISGGLEAYSAFSRAFIILPIAAAIGLVMVLLLKKPA